MKNKYKHITKKTAVLGKRYVHADNPDYGYAFLVEIIAPDKKRFKTGSIIAKCEWGQSSKRSLVGIIKYFKLSDLLEKVD